MIMRSFDQIGSFVVNQLDYTHRVLLMIYLTLRATVRDQSQGLRTIYSVISAQIYFTGFQALTLVGVLALASGSLIIMQTSSNLNIFGGTQMIGNILVAIILRELGPLMTALVVIARSGTAVASEVGNMGANREIEALEALGINPLSYIVFPRLVGGVISVICLSLFFVAVALVGGFFATKIFHSISTSFYFDSLAQSIDSLDLGLFLLKNTFSGMIIFMVSCYQGLSVKRSPTEVPIRTTQAVVHSIIYVVIFNLSVTALFYVNKLAKMGVL